jgi:hypothetical protein
MNTSIRFLYRDASNYKTSAVEILAGVLTDAEKHEIVGLLDLSEDAFIPGQVGLRDLQEDLAVYSDGRFTSDDRVWHEMLEDLADTDDSPTVVLTAKDLLAAFRATNGSWDVSAAAARLGCLID